MLSPADVGLPLKFQSWYPGQESVITAMLNPQRQFHVAVVPTGGGKSASYMAVALLSRGRTLILTSTKGLQDQLSHEFKELITVQKGRMAYKCALSGNLYYCHTGTCRWGYQCKYKNSGCAYHDSIRKARASRIVVTNYSFWMSNPPETLGEFSTLIMDEAHDAAEHLLSTLSMEIKKEDVIGLIPWVDRSSNQSQVYEWARILKGRVDDAVKTGRGGERGKVRFLNLQQKLRLLDNLWVENWVVEHKDRSVAFDAIWPAKLARSYLFRDIPKVILTSAFITKMDLHMLGIEEDNQEYVEYPSSFPTSNRPIWYIPTVRMDRNITDAGMNAWANRIDQIIGSRFGWKGIVHTVSYDRAMRVCGFSEYKDFMISNKMGGTSETVEKFKESDPPCTMVSPSVVTGYDFPGEEARWQIIGKVPFPDSRSLVMKARQKVFPDYGCNIALKQLVQTSGRIVRSPSDWGDTFVIDNHFGWVANKYRSTLPRWWTSAIRSTNIIPGVRG